MKKLLLIIGIPGAGKSTLANKIKAENPEFANANIWEADMFFIKNGEYNFNPNILGAAHHWCQAKVKSDMILGQNVIVSNTNLTPTERRPYIKLAKEYGYEVEVIECNGGFKNIHGVPETSLERMKKKYKPFEKWELDVK
jgi:predicted kinase